jgi:hypothetical protein
MSAANMHIRVPDWKQRPCGLLDNLLLYRKPDQLLVADISTGQAAPKLWLGVSSGLPSQSLLLLLLPLVCLVADAAAAAEPCI